jgi:arsenate reductase
MALPTSDDEVVLLYNPRCSKSRATKSLLEEQGIPFTERRYLEEPLSVDELKELGQRLERPAREWVRMGERAFAAAGLDGSTAEHVLFEAVAADPMLMERPIVIRGARAKVGRPPNGVLELFEEE